MVGTVASALSSGYSYYLASAVGRQECETKLAIFFSFLFFQEKLDLWVFNVNTLDL